jgi:proline iminopeptidase
LVADCDAIRQHLNIATWATLYGSSWGSTLAVIYAQRHTEVVRSLCISACFFPDEDFTWEWVTSPHGLPLFYPTQFAKLRHLIPNKSGLELVKEVVAQGSEATQAMFLYEALATGLIVDAQEVETYYKSPQGIKNSTIQVTYYSRRCDLQPGEQLTNAHKIAHLPIFIQQGLQDMVCPPAGAHRLAQALRAAGGKPTLEIIPACGHRATPAMEAARVAHLAALATQLQA